VRVTGSTLRKPCVCCDFATRDRPMWSIRARSGMLGSVPAEPVTPAPLSTATPSGQPGWWGCDATGGRQRRRGVSGWLWRFGPQWAIALTASPDAATVRWA
jgi:hypothetical protein